MAYAKLSLYILDVCYHRERLAKSAACTVW